MCFKWGNDCDSSLPATGVLDEAGGIVISLCSYKRNVGGEEKIIILTKNILISFLTSSIGTQRTLQREDGRVIEYLIMKRYVKR